MGGRDRAARPVRDERDLRKVVVSILTGGDAGAYLLAQRAAHMGRMRELTAVKTAPGTDLTTVLSADYALNHLDADLPLDDQHGGPAHHPDRGGPHSMTNGDTNGTTAGPLRAAAAW